MAKPVRSIEDIQQDFSNTLGSLGNLIWTIDKFEGRDLGTGQIGDTKRRLRVIENEFIEAKKELEKKTKQATPKTNGAPGLMPPPVATEQTQENAQQ